MLAFEFHLRFTLMLYASIYMHDITYAIAFNI